VPFDVAFSLDPITRSGWSIIMAEFEGMEFDRDSMTFRKPET
jgi:hypothetical protein